MDQQVGRLGPSVRWQRYQRQALPPLAQRTPLRPLPPRISPALRPYQGESTAALLPQPPRLQHLLLPGALSLLGLQRCKRRSERRSDACDIGAFICRRLSAESETPVDHELEAIQLFFYVFEDVVVFAIVKFKRSYISSTRTAASGALQQSFCQCAHTVDQRTMRSSHAVRPRVV